MNEVKIHQREEQCRPLSKFKDSELGRWFASLKDLVEDIPRCSDIVADLRNGICSSDLQKMLQKYIHCTTNSICTDQEIKKAPERGYI